MLDPFQPEDPKDVERLKALPAPDPRHLRRPRPRAAAARSFRRYLRRALLGRLLGRGGSPRSRPRRRPRRYPHHPARALRRQGAVPHDRAGAARRLLETPAAVGTLPVERTRASFDPSEILGAVEERCRLGAARACRHGRNLTCAAPASQRVPELDIAPPHPKGLLRFSNDRTP